MSNGYLQAVVKSPHAMHGVDFEVLVALADYANEKGESCPTVNTLSIVCAISQRTVRRCLHNLKKAGKIIPCGKSHNLPTRFKINLAPVTDGYDKSDRGGVTNLTGGYDKSDRGGVTNLTYPLTNSPGGVTNLTGGMSDLSTLLPDKKEKGVSPSYSLSTKEKELPLFFKNKSTDLDFISALKSNYKWLDIDKEVAKMKGWLLVHPERKLTRQFAINWLNKLDRPLNYNPASNNNDWRRMKL